MVSVEARVVKILNNVLNQQSGSGGSTCQESRCARGRTDLESRWVVSFRSNSSYVEDGARNELTVRACGYDNFSAVFGFPPTETDLG
jgi:hypothetical protein